MFSRRSREIVGKLRRFGACEPPPSTASLQPRIGAWDVRRPCLSTVCRLRPPRDGAGSTVLGRGPSTASLQPRLSAWDARRPRLSTVRRVRPPRGRGGKRYIEGGLQQQACSPVSGRGTPGAHVCRRFAASVRPGDGAGSAILKGGFNSKLAAPSRGVVRWEPTSVGGLPRPSAPGTGREAVYWGQCEPSAVALAL
jgi:hypothetical protein